MSYQKLTPVLQQIYVALILFASICSCSQNLETSQDSNDKIITFIDETIDGNLSVSKKLQIYDSLYLIIKKQRDDTLKRINIIELLIAYEVSNEAKKYLKLQRETEKLTVQIKDSFGLGYAYHNMGRYYAVNDKIDSAYFYYHKSKQIFDRFGGVKDKGKVYLAMGIMQKYAGDYVGAESSVIEAVKYLEKSNSIRYLASAYNVLGTTSRELGNYDEAINRFEKTFELREKVKSNNIVNAGTLNNIGSVYEYTGDYLTAIKYYREGLAYDSLLYKRPKTYIRLLDNLIYAQFLSGEDVDYPRLYKRSIRLSDSLQDLLVKSSSTLHLAAYYADNKKIDSASSATKESLVIAKGVPYIKILLESLQLLTEISEPKEALHYSKEYIRITDSLQKVERNYRDQFARIRYGAEELEEQNVKVSKQRTWLLTIVIGLLILGIISYLFFYQNRLKAQYQTINLEQRLLRSQLNPHFLFNALNAVSGLVQKQSDQTIPYISKLGNLLRSILENSREEFITLSEEVETLSTYLELQSDFSKKFNYILKVDDTLHQDDVLLPPMFIQPFVENAIQHGFQGKAEDKIVIHFTKDKKTPCCTIEDNGIGRTKNINTEKTHRSLSGTILKERLALYAKRFKTKAYYTITDLAGEEVTGTRVSLFLPYILDE